MIGLIYFVACVLFAAATSTYAALLDSSDISVSVVTADESSPVDVAIPAAEQSLLQRARRDSLNERVRRLRASSDDYVESARLLADRTDSLSQQTEQLVEERKSSSSQKGQDDRKSTVRLRRNKKDECSIDMCTSVCISDCNFVCSNPSFDRPSECDIPQFCEVTCSTGCKNESCKFAFDADELASQVGAHALLNY